MVLIIFLQCKKKKVEKRHTSVVTWGKKNVESHTTLLFLIKTHGQLGLNFNTKTVLAFWDIAVLYLQSLRGDFSVALATECTASREG